jgi:hypothetical protein
MIILWSYSHACQRPTGTRSRADYFWVGANAAVGASLKSLSESTIMKFLSGDEQLEICGRYFYIFCSFPQVSKERKKYSRLEEEAWLHGSK